MKEIIIDKQGRADIILMEILKMSRSSVQKRIKNHDILINGLPLKKNYNLKIGDKVVVSKLKDKEHIQAENIPLDIVYEDEDLLVINKKNGMVVHPAVGNKSKTLVNALMYYSKNLSDINGSFRPGIVHRIDAYTTGLLMVAKNNKTHEYLADQLKQKKTYRKYIALVHGTISHNTATIDAPIGRDSKDRKKMAVTDENSKNAVTHFKVLERYKAATLIEVTLETGRTHQIRVHMSYIKHPVINDKVYGQKKTIDDTGQCLHAAEIGFRHPNGTYMQFKSDLPNCFQRILKIYKDMR